MLGLSVAIIILGILFLLNAMQDMSNPDNIAFFTAFSKIDNVLAKYIVVILTMSCGIMLFSNVALRFPNKKRAYDRHNDVCVCVDASAGVRFYRNTSVGGKSNNERYARLRATKRR